MSDARFHCIQGASSAILLYPFIGTDSLIVGSSIVLIDIDHVFEYVHATGRLDMHGLYKLRKIAHEHFHEILGLNIFHTVECYLVLFFLGLYTTPKFYYILTGFLIHHFFDQIYLIKLGHPFVRASSILEYFIRRGKLITMKQLAKKYYTEKL